MTNVFAALNLSDVAPLVAQDNTTDRAGWGLAYQAVSVTPEGQVVCKKDDGAQARALGNNDNNASTNELKNAGLVPELTHTKFTEATEKAFESSAWATGRYTALAGQWIEKAQKPQERVGRCRDMRTVMNGKKPPAPLMRLDQRIALNAFRLARAYILKQPQQKVVSLGVMGFNLACDIFKRHHRYDATITLQPANETMPPRPTYSPSSRRLLLKHAA